MVSKSCVDEEVQYDLQPGLMKSLSQASLDSTSKGNKSQVEKGEPYNAGFLMRLDTKKLPKTLQGDGLVSEEWIMTTQRFEWQPTLFK